jgi:hypothetical protein
VFQVEIDNGVHSDSASLGSNPSPPARMSITSRQVLTVLLGLPCTSPPSIGVTVPAVVDRSVARNSPTLAQPSAVPSLRGATSRRGS